MKILLIDDHKLIKMGISILLQEYEEYQDVDSCSSYSEFLEKVNDEHFDLIISDISLSDKSGYEVLEYINEKEINSKVIILSMHEDKNYVKKALRLGARGYITKSTAHEEIIDAIRIVMNEDEIYLNTRYSSVFYEMYKEKDLETVQLSEREEEVLKYIAEGYTLTEIGEKLFLSVKTIDTYKKRLMEKLQLEKRSDLIDYYRKKYLN